MEGWGDGMRGGDRGVEGWGDGWEVIGVWRGGMMGGR